MIKGIQALNHEPDYIVGGTQSSPQAMSVGDLKENNNTVSEAPHKTVFLFSGACMHTIYTVLFI